MATTTFEPLLNSQIIVVGGSKSGKTTTIKNIIYDLAPKLNYIFLITCNECSIKDYAGIIPRQYEDANGYIFKLVRHFKVDEDKDIVRNSVQEIIDYASRASKIYECVNSQAELQRVSSLAKKYTGKDWDVKSQASELKSVIKSGIKNKDTCDILKFIKFQNYTPYSMIIFDDIIPISKALEPKIANLFIEGRHYNITTVVSS